MTATEIRESLDQFIGTTQWYKLGFGFTLTDGSKFVADECGAYWLMELIALHWYTLEIEMDDLIVAKLRPDGDSWIVTFEDGNYKVLKTVEIPYSDFPLSDGIDLFVQQQVIHLPSEH